MPQKQIGFYGKFTPTGVDTSGAQRLQALAKVADQVGDIAYKIGAVKAEKAGLEAGTKEGIAAAQKGEQIESSSGFGFFNQARDKAMKTAYLSEISTSALNNINQFMADHPDDYEAFDNKASSFINATLQNVSDEFRPLVEADLNNYLAKARTKVSTAENVKNDKIALGKNQAALNTFDDSAAKAAREGDLNLVAQETVKFKGVLDTLLENNDITQDKYDEAIGAHDLRVKQQQILGGIDKIIFNKDLSLEEQYQKGIEFIDNARKAELTDIDPEDKDQLLAVVERKVDGVRVAMEKEAAQVSYEDGLVISDLDIAATNNTRPADEIIADANELYRQKKITYEKRASIINKAVKVSEAEIKKANDIRSVSEALQGTYTGQPLRQEQIDTYYNDRESTLPTDASRSIIQAQFVSEMRMIPKRMKDEVSNALLSGDAARIQQASELIDRVSDMPGMFDQIVTPAQRAFALNVDRLSQVMSPEQAVQKAMELTDPSNQARIERVEAQIKKEKYADKYESWTDDALGDMPSIQQDNAIKQYQGLFETYLKSGMTEDDAKDAVERVLQNNWKEDANFGMMQYPPMDYYSIDGDTSYIRDQLYADISDDFAFGTTFKKENIFLYSDNHTERTASQGKPQYRVVVRDDNGELQYLNTYWTPDMQKEVELKKQENYKDIVERRAIQGLPNIVKTDIRGL